jgi:hypothetical protein
MLMDLLRQWVVGGGHLNHNPILLQIKGGGQKPLSPFKFNSTWLVGQEFKDLVKSVWIPLENPPQGQVVLISMKL